MSTTSLELAVRTQTAVTDLAQRVQARLSEERGQTAAEYMGLILVIAVMVVFLKGAGIGKVLGDGIKGAIGSIK